VKYIYCLTRDAGQSAFDAYRLGLGGSEVHPISFKGISALINEVDSNQIISSFQNALIHQAIVYEALEHSRSTIPCRFGTLFPDDKNILMFLREHYARLDDRLTRLEGKMEVGVQAIFNGKTIAAGLEARGQGDTETRGQGDTGISYLLEKKKQFDAVRELDEEADSFIQELNEAMSPLWFEVKAEKRRTEQAFLLSVCYLVGQKNLSSFKIAYQRFKRDKPNLRLLYTGPWPPYGFADMDFRPNKDFLL